MTQTDKDLVFLTKMYMKYLCSRVRQHMNGDDSTLTYNGVLTRRAVSNVGDEDDIIDCLVDDSGLTNGGGLLEEDEGTLLRGGYENYKSNGDTMTPNDEDKKPKASQVQRILEKSKANLSRSKSELGEQHRKVISQINKGRNEITEQNRRLLANITSGMERSKRLFPLNGFGMKGSQNGTKTCSNNNGSKDDDFPNNNPEAARVHKAEAFKAPVPNHQTKEDKVNSDLDRMLTDLGLQISAAEAATATTSGQNNNMMTQSVLVMGPGPSCDRPRVAVSKQALSEGTDSRQLEKTLENDYGEFDFIDGNDATLTRNETPTRTNNRLSASFYDEVLKELDNTSSSSRLRQSRHPSTSSLSATGGLVSPVSSTPPGLRGSNTSLSQPPPYSPKVSVYADHTLMLRHHQKRKWLLKNNKLDLKPEGSLRRCSSLSQTDTSNPFTNSQQPPKTEKKTWLSTTNNQVRFPIHTRLSIGGPNAAQKTDETNNNNRRSPWLLRGNLSSYARRRRGSSTSLHTVGMDDESEANGSEMDDENDSSNSMSLNRRYFFATKKNNSLD